MLIEPKIKTYSQNQQLQFIPDILSSFTWNTWHASKTAISHLKMKLHLHGATSRKHTKK